ncbi:AraC family transcriptional regulator [Flavobacterium amniphilum]|uniref:helix-turn-helix domain-containing protein n=1 Tax=Flavobacterium amniphilum TaxID=1834035 RepID=UPI00202AA672|nr:helix-turn-helix domain-containing protein [Flavobacterium amniphilum]MCL9807363.1 AraC family transcriptional regulator [Flavobacterium amniphilum]
MKKALLITFYLISIIENPVFSQTNSSKFQHLSYDELKRHYFEVVKTNTEKRELADLYIKKGIKENNRIKIARGYYYTAILFYENNPEKAITYLDSVIKYSKNNPDKSFPLSGYREKAYMLRKLYKYEEAIENYMLAEKLAKKTNLNFYYKVRLDIAALKSEELSQTEEALPIYRECYNYYKTKNTKSTEYGYCYNQTLFALADAYKTLHNTDSTTYYNQLGYNNSSQTNKEESKYLFVLNEGANLILKKKYKIAIDSITKALPKMIQYNNNINTIATYYYLGKAYEGLNNKSEAFRNYIRVDSVYQKTKEIYPEFIDGYNFLINHYKSTGNQKLELKYLNILRSIDSTHQIRYRNLNKIITKKYEIPELIANKVTTIQSLKGKNRIATWIISFLTVFALVLSIYLFSQRKQKIKYKKRFEKIIAEYKSVKSQNSDCETIAQNIENKTENNDISKTVINQILTKLQKFETKKEFLVPDISLQSLSEKFETNTSYLSKIINEYKGKNFVQYINSLRIDYAIKTLQEKSKLRNYSISALANEFGFNTSDSFSKAFFKQTGIKPSFFIKELNENENIENQ